MKLLQSFNFYGRDIKIRINNKEQINSLSGKILSYLTILIMYSFIWFIGNDIIFKHHPISYTNQILSSRFPKVSLNNNDFPISVGFADIAGLPFYNPLYVDMKLLKKTFFIDENTGKTLSSLEEEVKLVTCKYQHFPQITKDDFNKALLSTFLCPSIDFNFSLEGYWSTNFLSYLSLVVTKCNNETLKSTSNIENQTQGGFCLPSDEIDSYISYNSINIKISTLKTILTISNNEKPFSPYVSLIYKFLHSKNTKITNFLVQTQTLFTDIGLFFEENVVQKFMKLVELQTDSQEMNKSKGEFMRLNFYSSNISDHYYRKYVKIYDILANLGGFMKLLMMVFSILNRPFASVDKMKILMENINKNKDNEIANFDFNYMNFKKQSKIEKTSKTNLIKNIYKEKIKKFSKDTLPKINKNNQSSKIDNEIYWEVLKNNNENRKNHIKNNYSGVNLINGDWKIKTSVEIESEFNKLQINNQFNDEINKYKRPNEINRNRDLELIINKSDICNMLNNNFSNKNINEKDRMNIENIPSIRSVKNFNYKKSNNEFNILEKFNLNILNKDSQVNNSPMCTQKWQSRSLKMFSEAYKHKFRYSYFDMIKFSIVKIFCSYKKEVLKKRILYLLLHRNINQYLEFINIIKNMAHIDSVNEAIRYYEK